MAIVQVKDLIEAGVHFGHRASRWNPKMRPYIYGKRNLIHIIDLRETVRGLLRAYRYLAKVTSNGSLVVFVGTKRQAKETIEREAARCGMPFVSERWLGGTLTNYRTICDRLKRLQELETMWLPQGENPAKVDLPNFMKGMVNESGKLDLTKAPETAPIRGYSKKMVATLGREAACCSGGRDALPSSTASASLARTNSMERMLSSLPGMGRSTTSGSLSVSIRATVATPMRWASLTAMCSRWGSTMTIASGNRFMSRMPERLRWILVSSRLSVATIFLL